MTSPVDTIHESPHSFTPLQQDWNSYSLLLRQDTPAQGGQISPQDRDILPLLSPLDIAGHSELPSELEDLGIAQTRWTYDVLLSNPGGPVQVFRVKAGKRTWCAIKIYDLTLRSRKKDQTRIALELRLLTKVSLEIVASRFLLSALSANSHFWYSNEGLLYVPMVYHSRTLNDFCGTLTNPDVVKTVCAELMEGLSFLHRWQIDLDITPSSVFVCRLGHCRIANFSHARQKAKLSPHTFSRNLRSLVKTVYQVATNRNCLQDFVRKSIFRELRRSNFNSLAPFITKILRTRASKFTPSFLHSLRFNPYFGPMAVCEYWSRIRSWDSGPYLPPDNTAPESHDSGYGTLAPFPRSIQHHLLCNVHDQIEVLRVLSRTGDDRTAVIISEDNSFLMPRETWLPLPENLLGLFTTSQTKTPSSSPALSELCEEMHGMTMMNDTDTRQPWRLLGFQDL